jgi:hypothetical protein
MSRIIVIIVVTVMHWHIRWVIAVPVVISYHISISISISGRQKITKSLSSSWALPSTGSPVSTTLQTVI